MKKISPFILFTLVVAACNHSSDNNLTTKDMTLEALPPAPQVPATEHQDKTKKVLLPDTSFTSSSQSSASNQDWDKKIIKTAYMKVEVENFKKYADIIHKAANKYGGYIANEEQNQSEEKIEAVVTIKVPVDQFEPIMNDLPSGALKTIEKK